VRPDIVYFRDCTMIGVEAIALARRLSPDATILTALRPFFAGQVRQRSDGKIYRQSNDDFIRDTVVGRFFRAADLMTVPDEAMLPLAGPARLPPGRLHVLPEACLSLPGPVQLPPRDQIVIGLFGRAQLQSVSEIVARMLRILNCGDRLRVELFPISGEANELPPADDGLHIHPPCNAADIGLYMQECDLLLLADEDPTWSAIMVQEARAAGRPVACSQSSPVARSIVDGVDGFTFAASTAAALAGLMADLIEQPHLVRSTWQQLKPPVMPIEAAAHILASCEAFEKRSLEMLSL
jgi:glycosyltransferase involved in cell wall biosynthesis